MFVVSGTERPLRYAHLVFILFLLMLNASKK